MDNREKILSVATKIYRYISKLFWIFPIKNNRITCVSFVGKSFSCCPKYIALYLNNKYPNRFQVIYALRDTSEIKDIANIKFVKFLSIKHLFYLHTSQVVINNGLAPTYLTKRKGQYVINTWHGGGAYKKAEASGDIANDYYKSKNVDLVLSSCNSFDRIVPELVTEYTGEIMHSGMPRNDIFFGDFRRIKEKIFNYYNIKEGYKLVLFAPTYRGKHEIDSSEVMTTDMDVKSVCEKISKRFECNVTLAVRAHYSLSGMNLPDGCIDATFYPDMQELLCAADILISDYSSTIWDFSLTKKPCFLYCPDLDYYLNEDRGVYTPIETWPGILCRSNEELEQAILNFDEAEYVKKVEKHHADLGSYETGHACEQVCRRIAEVCGIEEGL